MPRGRSPELLFTSRTILLLADQYSQSEFERVQEVACKSQEGAQTCLSRVTIATTHRQQLVEDVRVHRRHFETPPTHRLLAPTATHTRTAQEQERLRRSFKMFAGTFGACPAAFLTPLARQKSGGQLLLSVVAVRCSPKTSARNSFRRPRSRHRDSVTSLRLVSQ